MAAAREADVVVLALGGASLWFTGERTEGEASDTADITLPAAQVRLAEAVAATGTPMVVVLVQGRAYALPQVIQDAAAIVVAPVRRPVRHPIDRRRPLRGGEPVGEAALQRAPAQRPDPGLPPPEGGLRLPQPAAARRHAALPRHGGHPAVAVRARAELHHVRPRATWTAGRTSTPTGTARISATVANTGDRDGAVVVQLYLRVNTTGSPGRPSSSADSRGWSWPPGSSSA